MSVYDNYMHVLEQIASCAEKYGRSPSEIKLLTVSKGQPFEEMAELASHGVKHFGESRVQDALPKMDEMNAAYEGLDFHFIGNIQTNKVKKMTGRFSLIHSVDRQEVAYAIDKASSATACAQDILIQLNLAREVQKGGIYEEDLEQLIEYIESCQAIRLRGFMIIQPYEDTKQHVRKYFALARNIFEKFSRHNNNIDILSMGMSSDMEEAIAEGSTLVRIGSAVFKK